MMDFELLNSRIPQPDQQARTKALAHWNGIAKPIGSLGLLEDAVVQIAALTGSADVRLKKRAVLVFCADNGVVAEGVTQTGQETTAIVAEDMVNSRASVCCIAASVRADVFPIDVGMAYDAPGAMQYKIARGTANFTKGPAMTRVQAEQAIRIGMEITEKMKGDRYDILATGELGIGNTTTAAAVVSALCCVSPETAAGRGAGLSDEGLARKIDAIRRGIELNRPAPDDAFDVLMKLGGFDIAGMAGVFIGGALLRVPVLVDGVISAAAALIASRLCPACTGAMIASHVSAEPAGAAVLAWLEKKPLITAGLRLGEGTGAALALPLLDAALAVYHNAASFDDVGMEAYEVHPQ